MRFTDFLKRRVDLAHRLFTLVHIFFTTFLIQIPIFHAPTFRAEAKSPILLGAMQACGALFVGNERASNFISTTLAYARETLVHDFVSILINFSLYSIYLGNGFNRRGNLVTLWIRFNLSWQLCCSRLSVFSTMILIRELHRIYITGCLSWSVEWISPDQKLILF